MVITCLVEFENNPLGIYFAGQKLFGKITLESDQVKRVQGINLIINGHAKTRWSETIYTGTSSITIVYSGQEDYIATCTDLKNKDGTNITELEPGKRTFSFACQLPQFCPSSFESQFGHIRYTIKVVLKRPWKFDKKFNKGFTVLKKMDLNSLSEMWKVPIQSQKQKVYCCGPFKSQPLKVDVSLSQSGYVPGQNILVNVMITNESRVPVEEIKVALKMVITYHCQIPKTDSKTVMKTVSKVKGEKVPRHCKKLLNFSLPVPATPSTCFFACKIIQIAYLLQVETKVKGMHKNHITSVPVTIGNVPLKAVVQEQPTTSAAASLSTSQNALTMSPAASDNVAIEAQVIDENSVEMLKMTEALNSDVSTLWSADNNIPPPSYEEALHMDHSKTNEGEDHDFVKNEFTPRYPVFRELNSTPELQKNGENNISQQ